MVSDRPRSRTLWAFTSLNRPVAEVGRPGELAVAGRDELIAPPVALLPNSVPCGPLRTSTRSRSRVAPADRMGYG